MHSFFVKGLQLQAHTSVEIELPGFRSFEIAPTDRFKFRLRLSQVNIIEYLSASGPKFEEAAETCRRMLEGDPFGTPMTAVLVDIVEFPGNTFWAKHFVLAALRLLTEGDVEGGPDIVSADSDGQRALFRGNDISLMTSFRDTVLCPEECARLSPHFLAVHENVERIKASPAIWTAFRYLMHSYVGRRLRNDHGLWAGSYTVTPLEDIILRLSIGLEAIFASSTRDDGGAIERRAAKLLRASGADARVVNRLCRWAYDVRNKVAHGSFSNFDEVPPDQALVAHLSNDRQHLTMCVRHVLRRSIVAMASELAAGRTLSDVLGSLDGRPPVESSPSWLPFLPWPGNPRERVPKVVS